MPIERARQARVRARARHLSRHRGPHGARACFGICGILLLASLAFGLFPFVGQVNFATAKAGMLGFTRALALEVAARGVTVNAVSPGYIRTSAGERLPPDVLERLAASVPMRRLARPEDVAGACASLASDEAGYITGIDHAVNGGLYMD